MLPEPERTAGAASGTAPRHPDGTGFSVENDPDLHVRVRWTASSRHATAWKREGLTMLRQVVGKRGPTWELAEALAAETLANADVALEVDDDGARPKGCAQALGSPAAVSRALANAGAVRSGVLKVGGKSKKLVAVRNREYWRKHQRERKLWADNYPRQVKAGAFGRRTKK